MSESFEQNDAVDPIRTDLDYWKNLKETCEKNQKALWEREFEADEEEKGEVKMEFVKEQLVEMTKLIDNKIESIFKIAQDEESDTSAHLLTSEFFVQLIELCDDMCWLILRIPEELTGRRLFKKYVNGFEEVLKTMLGMERIWWSIRRGYSGLPRNRDYSTVHLFGNLKTEAIEDARDQFNDWIDELNGSINPLKRVDSQEYRLVSITFNIIKKIRLNNSFVPIDAILDSSETLISILKDLTNSFLMNPLSIMTIHQLSCSLNRQLHQLIELSEPLQEDEWFTRRVDEIDVICEEIDEMNPIR